MKLRVQVRAEKMENDSGITWDVVCLLGLAERHRVEFVILHAASLGQFADSLHDVLLVGGQLQKWDQLWQHRNVLQEMLIRRCHLLQPFKTNTSDLHVSEAALLKGLVSVVNGNNERL